LTLACLFATGIAHGEAPPPTNNAATDNAATNNVESHWLSNLRQVTSGYVKAGEGYFSPDGQTIVYQAISKGYPFYQIYTQPLAGKSKPRRISTGRGRTTCSYFSPDGKRLASAGRDKQTTANAIARIVAPIQTAHQSSDVRISRNVEGRVRLFSPSGSTIVLDSSLLKAHSFRSGRLQLIAQGACPRFAYVTMDDHLHGARPSDETMNA